MCESVIIPLGVQCCTEKCISSLKNSNENLQAVSVTSELFSIGSICDCPEICIWRCGQVCSAALAFVLSREPSCVRKGNGTSSGQSCRAPQPGIQPGVSG